jgi:hypothetical protein
MTRHVTWDWRRMKVKNLRAEVLLFPARGERLKV